MATAESLLTPEEEQEVIEAIRAAERTTSGEIRVHLETKGGQDPLLHASEIFHLLKMDNTKQENGVLIYVAAKDRKFAIYGDTGINDVVPAGFWDSTRDIIQSHFKAGKFKQGLVEGIKLAGEQLQKYFPWDHTDTNELSDEISKG